MCVGVASRWCDALRYNSCVVGLVVHQPISCSASNWAGYRVSVLGSATHARTTEKWWRGVVIIPREMGRPSGLVLHAQKRTSSRWRPDVRTSWPQSTAEGACRASPSILLRVHGQKLDKARTGASGQKYELEIRPPHQLSGVRLSCE